MFIHLLTQNLPMRTTRFSLSVSIGTLFALSLLNALPTIAQTSLETELLNIMRGKSAAYEVADTEAWEKYWIQDAHSSRLSIDKFEYSQQVGWEDLITQYKKDSEEIVSWDSLKMTFENIHLRTSGDMAFLEFDERWRRQNKDTLVGTIHTYAVFMKENKVWKIANQIRVATSTYTDKTLYREYELNTIGYDLLKEKRVSEAIDVFALIVKHNPTSWNAYDSLGEGYALAGDKALAIKNYEKSLELNPESEAGKKALAILKQN